MAAMQPPPIFIHSLFRSGSTYLFQKFREAGGRYTAFKEPLHELHLTADDRCYRDRKLTETIRRELRHPPLDRPYFQEFEPWRLQGRSLFRKEFPFDRYFLSPDDDCEPLRRYLAALLASAGARPVFAFTRSPLRAAWLDRVFQPVSLFLWRDPRQQWRSYRVNGYFPTTNLLILNAGAAHPVIAALRQRVGFTEFHDPDLFREFAHFEQRPLPPDDGYLVFHVLWQLARRAALDSGQLSIHIDALAHSASYREQVEAQLRTLGVEGLDFRDCAVPVLPLDKEEVDRCQRVEEEAQALLARLTPGSCPAKGAA